MALCKCPECGKENVSNTAKSCPNCGYNIKSYHRKLKINNSTSSCKELIERFFQSRKRKVMALTFLIGLVIVAILVTFVDMIANYWIMIAIAIYFVAEFLVGSYVYRLFVHDAAWKATLIDSPFIIFAWLFLGMNELGWVTETFFEWGLYLALLASILIIEGIFIE